MAETAKVLDPQVKERLDKINWKGLEDTFGITREQIEKRPQVAKDLAYGAMTDLIPFSKNGISGEISLRAQPTPNASGKLWDVKGYTKLEPKTADDKLFFYGEEVYSKTAKKNLFEMTSWEGSDGKRKQGRANASTGIPVSIAFPKRDENGQIVKNEKGEIEREPKKSYIMSIHQPTNQLVGIEVEKLKAKLQNSPNGVSMYGVKLTDAQVEAVAMGKAVTLQGCKNSKGEKFDSFPGLGTPVQFDVAKMTLVAVHPTALKQAMQMGAGATTEKVEQPKERTSKKTTSKKTTETKQQEVTPKTNRLKH